MRSRITSVRDEHVAWQISKSVAAAACGGGRHGRARPARRSGVTDPKRTRGRTSHGQPKTCYRRADTGQTHGSRLEGKLVFVGGLPIRKIEQQTTVLYLRLMVTFLTSPPPFLSCGYASAKPALVLIKATLPLWCQVRTEGLQLV